MAISFSLIVPTRKREWFFLNLCKSIEKNTNDLNNIEFLAIIDEDDHSAKRYSRKYSWVKVLEREQGNNLSDDYHNWATFQSNGKYIFILNDDCEIGTKNWDIIAWDKLENENCLGIVYGRTVNYGGIIDYSRNYFEGSYFPIVSRLAVDVLGHAMSPFFPGWGADLQLYSVFNKVKAIVDLNEIIVKYNEIYDECRSLMENRPMLPISEEDCEKILEEDVNKLRRYFGKFKLYL